MELNTLASKRPYQNVPTDELNGKPKYPSSSCRFEKIVKDDRPYLVAIDNSTSPYKDVPEEESTSYLMAIDSSLPSPPEYEQRSNRSNDEGTDEEDGQSASEAETKDKEEKTKKVLCSCSHCCLILIILVLVCTLLPISYFLLDITLKYNSLEKRGFNQTLQEDPKTKENTKLELKLKKSLEEFQKEREKYLHLFHVLRGKTEENYNRSITTKKETMKYINDKFKTLNTNTSNELQKLRGRIEEVNDDIGLKKDCLEIYKSGSRTSKVYTIRPFSNVKLKVFCDQDTAEGGWTVVQRRVDKSVSFDRPWSHYKKGFGDLTGNFWLGNDYLHMLTSLTGERQEIRFDIEEWSGFELYAVYSRFSVANETKQYELELGDYGGNAGDAALMKNYTMNGMKFSTIDRDNDKSDLNCASAWGGGWWFNACFGAFLNGPYKRKGRESDQCSNSHWFYRSSLCEYSIKKSEMKIRRL